MFIITISLLDTTIQDGSMKERSDEALFFSVQIFFEGFKYLLLGL